MTTDLDTSPSSLAEGDLFRQVRTIIDQAKHQIVNSVNSFMVQAYWNIGRAIREEEQKGTERAEYGKAIIETLAKKLKEAGEHGFESRNLWTMRKFYTTYPILNALRSELSWTHYRILLGIEDPQKRGFYETECVKSKWSTRELERQVSSLLFERLALSRDKQGVMELAQQGAEPAQTSDIVKDPYVLEFLGIRPNERYL